MGWVKLDDGFPMHPKVVSLSLEARWAYVEALCYSARYETDGVVPSNVAANGPVRDELVSRGLWENGPAAITIHDYLVYNLSRKERRALSKKRAKAGSTRKQTANKTGAKSEQSGSQRDGTGTGLGVGVAVQKESFDDFWAAYPRHDGGRAAAKSKFDSKVRAGAEPAAIVAGALQFRDDPNRDEQFTPHATTWLNQERWDDPPLPARGKPELGSDLLAQAAALREQGR
jgi:hypothetical protein